MMLINRQSIFFMFFAVSFFQKGTALSAEWTQYSDSASLPMSKRYRDDMREKLTKIDIASLNEVDRRKVLKLRHLLTEVEDDSPEPAITKGYTYQQLFMLIFVLSIVYYVYKRLVRRVYIPDAQSIRQARESKYE